MFNNILHRRGRLADRWQGDKDKGRNRRKGKAEKGESQEKVGKPLQHALMGSVERNRRIVRYINTESCIDRGAIQSRHEVELGLLGLGGKEEELIFFEKV